MVGLPAGSAGRLGASDVRHDAVSGWRVGVGDGEALEDLALKPLHLLRIAVVLVVIAQQMEKSMDGKMREMMVERLALGDRLARDGLIGDDDVADIWGARTALLPGAAAGNDSTLVGAFLPRQSRLSVRIAESSVSTIASSVGGVETASAAAKTAFLTMVLAVGRLRQRAERTMTSICDAASSPPPRLRGRVAARRDFAQSFGPSLAPRRRAASALS